MADRDRPAQGAPLPVPTERTLDRSAMERVLARAAELQMSGANASDRMTESELVALGSEVGLPAEHLRQALAEERTRVAPREAEGVPGWFGPESTVAQRVVKGKPAELLAALDATMQREFVLQVRRRFSERITWESRRDFMSAISRGFNVGGRAQMLSRADEVSATVVPVDDARVLVRLEANFDLSRRKAVRIGAGAAGTGALGAFGVVAFAASVAGASIAIAGVIGALWAVLGAGATAAVASSQRSSTTRAHLALEQLLDRLEHGDLSRPAAASLLDAFGASRLLR